MIERVVIRDDTLARALEAADFVLLNGAPCPCIGKNVLSGSGVEVGTSAFSTSEFISAPKRQFHGRTTD